LKFCQRSRLQDGILISFRLLVSVFRLYLSVRPITTDVAWHACLSVCLSVCLLDTTVSLTKTDEPIEVPFGLRTWVGPSIHVLGEGSRGMGSLPPPPLPSFATGPLVKIL